MPRTAMVRGALGAGPVLGVGIATGHAGAGVLAALGAMLAGVNDRPGTRRKGVVGIGCPAVAGSLGLMAGAVVADSVGRWSAVPVLFLVGWLSGALSTVGAVWSAASLQMLVTLTVGLGMPMPGPAWFKAVCFFAGAVWLLLLRLLLRLPRSGGETRSSGEREAVAAVFDALADALRALGGPQASAARRRLVAAQQQADEALRLLRLLPWPARGVATVHPLAARFGVAVALCEASIALLWEGRAVPEGVTEGPRRLAAAVRSGGPAGPLPSPVSDTVERTAFDHALLEAAVVFDRTLHGAADAVSRNRSVPYRPLRSVLSPAGREYGLRVALCVTVTGVVALLLHEVHWYWLPATAAFLVKPDMGPLFSRVVNRFAGTVAGVLAFLLCTTVSGGLGAPGTVALVVVGGALLPFSVRHFGLQTAVITVLVLSFVRTAGDTEAAPARLLETTLACVIVLLVGHLPRLTDPRVRVGHRCAATLRCTELYLRHVLAGPAEERQDPRRSGAQGLALRNAAYRALAEARAAAETAAAELPGPYGKRHDWAAVTDAAELIVDAATACALRVEHGVPRPAAAEVEKVTSALSAAADALEGGRGGTRPGSGPRDCRSLRDVMTHLHGIHTLTTAA